jgi:hypothetical protein
VAGGKQAEFLVWKREWLLEREGRLKKLGDVWGAFGCRGWFGKRMGYEFASLPTLRSSAGIGQLGPVERPFCPPPTENDRRNVSVVLLPGELQDVLAGEGDFR